MAHFKKGGTVLTPFGKNVYLRSVQGLKFDPYTVARTTIPSQTIDGVAGQKILQPGTVMAKITSGPETGKVGPYQASGTAEVQTITPTTVSAGTFTLSFKSAVTAPIAFNATAATIQAALESLSTVGVGNVACAGGPINTTAVTVTFFGELQGDQPMLVEDETGLTGTLAITQTTQGVAGAADGRQTAANIVGLNDTFLPWQLMERDVEIAVAYEATAVQGWCFELNAAGVAIALTNTTADAVVSSIPVFRSKKLDIKFV